MGPVKFLKPLVRASLLVLLLSVPIGRAHTGDAAQANDDLIEDDVSTATDDDAFSVKLDDYEIEYKTPTPSEPVHMYETFDDIDAAKKKWIVSKAQKEDSDNVFKYDGEWDFELPERRIFPNDRALVLKSKAKHAAIAAKLNKKFEFTTKPLIVQYEVTFQNGMDCGGAYIKLLSDSKDLSLENFHDRTPYTIMFGPDKCGSDIKLHFIFRHKNPLNGTFEEKHAKRPSNRVEDAFNDKKPHLYRLVLKPDNRFEVFVDGLLINQGSLLEDMEPPINPPIEIEDPDDTKPEDWDEREKIPDPNAAKPADWDEDAPPKIPDPSARVPDGWLEEEPEVIPDPTATMPEDWDESMDGTWEAPLIPNPRCEGAVGCGPWTAPLVENPNFQGKWKPPMVSNPNYKGKWSRRRIPNPNYFEDKEPFKMTPIGAVGIEIWTMTDMVLFDNFIISDKESVVNEFTENTHTLKSRALERDSRGVFERIINYSNARPWLYALYTILIGLPVVLIIAFCCGGSSQDKKSDIAAADPVPDEDEDDAVADSKSARASAKKGPQNRSRNTISQSPAPPETSTASSKPKNSSGAKVGMSKDDLEQPEPQQQENNESEDEEDLGSGNADDAEESDADNEPVDERIPSQDEQQAGGLKKRRIRRD